MSNDKTQQETRPYSLGFSTRLNLGRRSPAQVLTTVSVWSLPRQRQSSGLQGEGDGHQKKGKGVGGGHMEMEGERGTAAHP